MGAKDNISLTGVNILTDHRNLGNPLLEIAGQVVDLVKGTTIGHKGHHRLTTADGDPHHQIPQDAALVLLLPDRHLELADPLAGRLDHPVHQRVMKRTVLQIDYVVTGTPIDADVWFSVRAGNRQLGGGAVMHLLIWTERFKYLYLFQRAICGELGAHLIMLPLDLLGIPHTDQRTPKTLFSIGTDRLFGAQARGDNGPHQISIYSGLPQMADPGHTSILRQSTRNKNGLALIVRNTQPFGVKPLNGQLQCLATPGPRRRLRNVLARLGSRLPNVFSLDLHGVPRWRAASNNTIPPATEAFRDDTPPYCGIASSTSHCLRTRGRNPSPSPPTTSTRLPRRSA